MREIYMPPMTLIKCWQFIDSRNLFYAFHLQDCGIWLIFGRFSYKTSHLEVDESKLQVMWMNDIRLKELVEKISPRKLKFCHSVVLQNSFKCIENFLIFPLWHLRMQSLFTSLDIFNSSKTQNLEKLSTPSAWMQMTLTSSTKGNAESDAMCVHIRFFRKWNLN